MQEIPGQARDDSRRDFVSFRQVAGVNVEKVFEEMDRKRENKRLPEASCNVYHLTCNIAQQYFGTKRSGNGASQQKSNQGTNAGNINSFQNPFTLSQSASDDDDDDAIDRSATNIKKRLPVLRMQHQ